MQATSHLEIRKCSSILLHWTTIDKKEVQGLIEEVRGMRKTIITNIKTETSTVMIGKKDTAIKEMQKIATEREPTRERSKKDMRDPREDITKLLTKDMKAINKKITRTTSNSQGTTPSRNTKGSRETTREARGKVID